MDFGDVSEPATVLRVHLYYRMEVPDVSMEMLNTLCQGFVALGKTV